MLPSVGNREYHLSKSRTSRSSRFRGSLEQDSSIEHASSRLALNAFVAPFYSSSEFAAFCEEIFVSPASP